MSERKRGNGIIGRLEAVLIDDELLLEVAQRRLDESDWHLLTFAGPQQGMTQLRTRRPDALFVDVRMPEMNGTDLLRALRAEGVDFHLKRELTRPNKSTQLARRFTIVVRRNEYPHCTFPG